jgi:hypothetical protein
LDRWRVEREALDAEQVYLSRLIRDLETDIPNLERAVKLQSLRLDMVELLMTVSANPDAANEHPIKFLGAISQAAYTYTPSLQDHTFETLRTTGDIRLIRKAEVREALFSYYNLHEGQLQYRPLEIETESRHFALGAGILDLAQSRYIQDNHLFFDVGETPAAPTEVVDQLNILAAAVRLSKNRAFVDWLPYTRAMQLEQIDVHQLRKLQAQRAVALSREYLASLRNPSTAD